MNERDDGPPQRPDQGAMTEATGSLTPDDADDAFVPAETREVNDPAAARDLTAATYRRREARRGVLDDDPGSLRPRGEDTAPNDRDGGYGSEHGLSGEDPAYRQEEHLPEREGAAATGDEQTRLGGDEHHDPADEHF